MLNVEEIQNGVVIDHITPGKGLEIYRMLHLEEQPQSVALLQSVKSQKYGSKDLIEIEGNIFRADILGYPDERITLIYIQNNHVVNKFHPTPPMELKNVIKCTNPRCITSIESNCEHIFCLSKSKKYRCIYCNQEMTAKK